MQEAIPSSVACKIIFSIMQKASAVLNRKLSWQNTHTTSIFSKSSLLICSSVYFHMECLAFIRSINMSISPLLFHLFIFFVPAKNKSYPIPEEITVYFAVIIILGNFFALFLLKSSLKQLIL